MDQDKKTPAGAPSSDTTSALFVSARKKQLEQQETERRAKEKEDQRLAAEAEVRRLEAEVEERRRKAEEDARQADADAHRIAQEAHMKKAQAAVNPDAVIGVPMQQSKIPVASNKTKPAANGSFPANLLGNKKLLAIIGGGAAALVLLIVILVSSLGGGSKTPYLTASGFDMTGSFINMETTTQLSLYASGNAELIHPDNSIETGTYTIEDDYIIVSLDGVTHEFMIITEDGLGDENFDLYVRVGSDLYYQEADSSVGFDSDDEIDSPPNGSVTFTDPKTGIQLYHPEYMFPMHVLDSPDIEIVSIFYDGDMLFVMNFTDLYDDLVLTNNHDDATLLRILSNAFLRAYSETIFETENWATALGTQDFLEAMQAGVAQELAPWSAPYFDYLAHFSVVLNIDGEDLYAYMALLLFPDHDYKIFTFMYWWDMQNDIEALENVIYSMRIPATR